MAGTEGQLAPELHKHLSGFFVPEGYNGKAVDVFNAGIVLFNLLFATGPFYNADKTDFYYQHIARNEGTKFWAKQAERNLDIGSVSVETLSMIESMMSYDPSNRPSVQMIIEATEMIIRAKCASLNEDSLEAVPL